MSAPAHKAAPIVTNAPAASFAARTQLGRTPLKVLMAAAITSSPYCLTCSVDAMVCTVQSSVVESETSLFTFFARTHAAIKSSTWFKDNQSRNDRSCSRRVVLQANALVHRKSLLPFLKPWTRS